MHKLRRQFESERKAHRNNFYKSIIYNEGTVDNAFDTYDQKGFGHNATINPKWGKNLMPKFETFKEGIKNIFLLITIKSSKILILAVLQF